MVVRMRSHSKSFNTTRSSTTRRVSGLEGDSSSGFEDRATEFQNLVKYFFEIALFWRLLSSIGPAARRTGTIPVGDATELKGRYDFELQYGHVLPDDVAGTGSDKSFGQGVSIFTALREQLGLTLADERTPISVLLIENAQRPAR